MQERMNLPVEDEAPFCFIVPISPRENAMSAAELNIYLRFRLRRGYTVRRRSNHHKPGEGSGF